MKDIYILQMSNEKKRQKKTNFLSNMKYHTLRNIIFRMVHKPYSIDFSLLLNLLYNRNERQIEITKQCFECHRILLVESH